MFANNLLGVHLTYNSFFTFSSQNSNQLHSLLGNSCTVSLQRNGQFHVHLSKSSRSQDLQHQIQTVRSPTHAQFSWEVVGAEDM